MNFLVKHKLSVDGLITGAVLEFNNDKVIPIRKGEFSKVFNAHNCANASLSKDNKILPNRNIEIPTLTLTKEQLILFHGSKSGITGNINPNKSRIECDFGMGFYTGNNIKQAEGLLSNYPSGKVYALYCDTRDLKTYKFKDATLWALFVGINRNFIDINTIPKFKPIFNDIMSHDIIIGPIADDKMQEVFPRFMQELIPDTALSECLKLVKLGNQWVFKTVKACSKITVLGCSNMSTNDLINAKKHQDNLKKNINGRVADVIKAHRRDGRFIDDILGDYK